jgi:hypothetical protein
VIVNAEDVPSVRTLSFEVIARGTLPLLYPFLDSAVLQRFARRTSPDGRGDDHAPICHLFVVRTLHMAPTTWEIR